MTNKGLDIKQLSIRLIRTGDQVLHIASHQEKYHIYIYGDKLQFIDIHIGEKYQQVNATPDSIWSRTRSLWDRMINFSLGK